MLRVRRRSLLRLAALSPICLPVVLSPARALASTIAAPALSGTGSWWDVTPEPYEAPLSDNGILYSQIAPRLRELETSSNRVRIEVIGQSAGGRNLFLATISAPEALGRLGSYRAIRETMLKDPAQALDMIDKLGDFKVPVMINASIHGGEVCGVDAAMRLIEKLAFENGDDVRQILDNEIVLVNVVQNPDGRVLGTRGNSNGFDVNRDFITQSQPETRATVKVLTEWNPMIFLDLHGFTNPTLIEPCTPPHNPNYEYDLYIKWALGQAEAMEAEIKAETGFGSQIPFRDRSQGWDDWPPIFAPMYAMYHGAYGHTIETAYRDPRGVDIHFASVWGALKFAAANREAMVRDQVEIFERGFLGSLQVPIPDDILDQTPYNQYNSMTTMVFPKAYVIPAGSQQQSPFEAARLVDFLLRNDVEVSQSVEAVSVDGKTYPAGSYVVWMDQPKRGLANTVLWDGWDISYAPGLSMYDISGWSHPLIWGVTRVAVDGDLAVKTRPILKADAVAGAVETLPAKAYAYLPDSNDSIVATNELLAAGKAVYRSISPFTDRGRDFDTGTFVIAATDASARATANDLASRLGLMVYSLQGVPSGAIELRRQKVATSADEGANFVLRQLGFDVTALATADLNADALNTGSFDAWVNSSRSFSSLSAAGKTSVAAFIARGGGYVGVGRTGVPFASSANAKLLTFTSANGLSDDNGILRVNYTPSDQVAAQYRPASYGFVYGPLWFTSVGPGVEISATVDTGDFFVSGFWKNWKTSGAAGQPIVVHGRAGSAAVTLMGINPSFRAHPELTFRMLANAIFGSLD